jgi:phospholipid/cholesterol/gamma-HCH transport system substrate-binding protein
MSTETRREMVVGTAVLAVATLIFLYSSSGIGDRLGGGPLNDGAYELTARFGQADGITSGTKVRLSGMPVGQVVDMRLDDYYRAVVTMRLAGRVELPVDSAALIQTDGLLGGKYVELEPGGALDMLAPGDSLDYTQDSVIIERLLAKIVARAKEERGLDPNESVGY